MRIILMSRVVWMLHGDVAWADVAWVDSAWADVAYVDVSRVDFEWADVAWADVAWVNFAWADFAWADVGCVVCHVWMMAGRIFRRSLIYVWMFIVGRYAFQCVMCG